MRHRKKKKILDRKKETRQLLLRNLAESLFQHGKIVTTLAKAKSLRPLAERLITKAKVNNLGSRRYLLRYLSPKTTNKLLSEIGPKYQERKGGYLRLIKFRYRSDSALLVRVELV